MTPFNYILFDAARAGQNLYKAMELNPDNKSLYKGWAEEDLAGVAPYLFSVKPDSDFVKWFLKDGWGQSWGVLLFANAAFEDVYKHFRQFLMVKKEDGQQLYFRFYDPRVLRIFLPTCGQQQLKDFFGPVRHYITEGDKPGNGIQFSLENYVLRDKLVELVPEEPKSEEPAQQEERRMQPESEKPADEESATSILRRKRKFNLDVE